ncbi:anti-sigma factor [Methylobacterium platani]|uniref:Anti-sigma K factor RskA C-terminal domain-containing protein n=2 Tax=Methylobacterium platani TaxID=427683 RepID=A0A179SEW7_9HYPH|nr:anti-sigma factor [Methylobacterium platani]KMO17381.1 hypothetical protein SQ03_12510 [Methylobacterium platani JCM 14648]OAS26417.1 hypothetical protein A5481_04995 [Methylobacterium platani]
MSGGTDRDVAPFWAEDPDGAAGEYVLGTLSAEERAAFARALERDTALREAVTAWEKRLAPLAEAVPTVAPAPRVWEGIEARIGSGGGTASPDAPRPGAERVVRLERGLRRWRAAAGFASALAAGLALWIVVPHPATTDGRQYLAVVDRGGTLPALIVRVDLDGRTVQVRSLAAETPPDRSLELWYVGAGSAPRSLGLVGDASLTLPAGLRGVADGASLAVSVEPKGGSSTGAPTGPVIYSGRLIRE